MKKFNLIIIAIFIANFLSAQFIARMEVKGPLPGACDSTNVYALFQGFKGQVPPVAPITKEALQEKLNNEVDFLKVNAKFKGKMMINCIINCKGEMIQCTVDNKSGEPVLDEQVLKIFQTMTHWTAGYLSGNAVDCSILYSLEIKKGKIVIS